MSRAIALLLLLTACPDPTTDATATTNGAPGGEGAAPAPPPEGAAPPPAGQGGRPAAPGFQVEAGKGVKLSGTISYPGTATGTYRIDFLRAAEGSGFPELLHALSMDKPGSWEVEAPPSAGLVTIVSYLDAGEDGPSSGEPAVLYNKPVDIGTAPITDIALVLSDNPDLGDFAPRGGAGMPPGAAPDGAAGAPPGGPPPDGAPAGPPPEGAAPAGPPAEGAAGTGAPAGAAPAAGAPAAPTSP